MCGHHPLSPCIIWLSQLVNLDNGYAFQWLFTPFSQWRHLHIKDASPLFCWIKHNWTSFLIISMLKAFEVDILPMFGLDKLWTFKRTWSSCWFLTRLHEHVSPDIVESSNPSPTFSGSDTFPFKVGSFFQVHSNMLLTFPLITSAYKLKQKK